MAHNYNSGYAVVDTDPNLITSLQSGHKIKKAVLEDGSKRWVFKEGNPSGSKWEEIIIGTSFSDKDGNIAYESDTDKRTGYHDTINKVYYPNIHPSYRYDKIAKFNIPHIVGDFNSGSSAHSSNYAHFMYMPEDIEVGSMFSFDFYYRSYKNGVEYLNATVSGKVSTNQELSDVNIVADNSTDVKFTIKLGKYNTRRALAIYSDKVTTSTGDTYLTIHNLIVNKEMGANGSYKTLKPLDWVSGWGFARLHPPIFTNVYQTFTNEDMLPNGKTLPISVEDHLGNPKFDVTDKLQFGEGFEFDPIEKEIQLGNVDANTIADGSVSNDEFQYLNGLTQNINVSLAQKEETINKSPNFTSPNNISYPTTKAVADHLEQKLEPYKNIKDLGYGTEIESLVDSEIQNLRDELLDDVATYYKNCLKHQFMKFESGAQTKPTIALIPTAEKVGTVYSVLPSNRTGDFTFERDTTATRTNKDGVIETMAIDEPRLDYADGGCPKILLENQSTNLYLNSSVLVTQSNTLVTDTYTVSFKGSGSVTFSGSYSGVLNGVDDNTRVQLTLNSSAGILISTVSGDVVESQLEQGSKATSYIPTNGTSETRGVDLLYNNSNLINPTKGTFFIEGSKSSISDSQVLFNDGTSSNRVYLKFNGSSSDSLSLVIVGSATTSRSASIPNFNYLQENKYAFAWGGGVIKLLVNGSLVINELNASEVNDLNYLNFKSFGNVQYFDGRVSKAYYYNKVLSDQELIDLTK